VSVVAVDGGRVKFGVLVSTRGREPPAAGGTLRAGMRCASALHACHAHHHHSPHDHLPLRPAGRVRRPPAHVPAAGQPRPPAASDGARDQAQRPHPLVARRLRQLDRHRDLRGPSGRASPGEHHSPRALPRRRPRVPAAALEFPIEAYARHHPFSYSAEEIPDLGRTIELHYPDPGHKVDEWARRFVSSTGKTETQALLVDMTAAIGREFRYEAREAEGTQTPWRRSSVVPARVATSRSS
jgi:hypothetical protein